MASFGHRARLTAVTAISAGLLLLILFALAVVGFYGQQLKTAEDEELAPALRQSEEEFTENKLAPDLAEVVAAYPEMSVAVYDRRGDLISWRGNIRPQLVSESGIGDIDGVPVAYAYRKFEGATFVGALGWVNNRRDMQHFTILLASLWFPVTALIGFITWSSARSTFVPLQRLSRQAEALSAEDLSSRLQPETGEYAEFGERLNRFLERIEKSVKREERFVSDAAHELRTPLTVMGGRVETALLKDRNPDEYRRTLRDLGAETERLAGLVEVLLQSSTIVQEEVPEIDLEENAERAHARWVDRFTERNVELVLESEPSQGRLLEREFDILVDNLLSNAVKASPSGSVCVLRLASEPGIARIEVIDQGPGIPAERAEDVFERFTRLDEGRNREEGGFGIGLAVCTRIANGRGGRVYLEPATKGAHFVVELPA